MHTVLEQGDVFVDACSADHRSQLLFISAYGRDTSIQQFMARLHVDPRQGGIDSLTVRNAMPGAKPAERLQVLVGDPKRLTKVTGRMPKTGLLGNLVHAWIFDPALLDVDHTSRSAWHLRAGGAGDQQQDLDAAWRLVLELSPVPLMSHWCLPTLGYLQARKCLTVPPSLGPIRATRVEVPEDFSTWVSARVRDGDFTEQLSGLHGEPIPARSQRAA